MCVEFLFACSCTVPSAWDLRHIVIAVEVIDPTTEPCQKCVPQSCNYSTSCRRWAGWQPWGAGKPAPLGHMARALPLTRGRCSREPGGHWQSLCSLRSGTLTMWKAWHPPDGSRRSTRLWFWGHPGERGSVGIAAFPTGISWL